MSGYILCQVPRAKVPYYIENISTNIYSIEELCYYFHHNLCLVDSSVMNEGLSSWVRDGLKLKGLHQKLRSACEKEQPGIRDFVYPVFKEINYLSYEEMKDFDAQVAALEAEPPSQRMKMKGDSLVENGMYVNALKVYQELLRSLEDQEGRASFWGSIYHNMGCAYSYLFQKEEALECFELAYEKLHTGNSLKSYLFAFYNARTPIEYVSKLADLGVDDQTREAVQREIDLVNNKDTPAIQDHQIDGLLEKMTLSYHRSTGS